MKTATFIATFIIIGLTNAYSQNNIVLNGGFEQPDNNASLNVPSSKAEADWLLYWEDKLHIEQISGNLTPFDYNDNNYALLHSPDWYSNHTYTYPNSNITLQHFQLFENQMPVQAHTGGNFIGMNPFELLQQKIPSSNKMDEEEEYTLSIFIRTAQNGPHSISWAGSNTFLKVYLRKNDMAYTHAANQYSNSCTDTYHNHQNVTSNNTIEIMNISINPLKFPHGAWTQVTSSFKAPDNSFDWIIIETVDDNYNFCSAGSYLLIDDISIFKGCLSDLYVDNKNIDYDIDFKASNNIYVSSQAPVNISSGVNVSFEAGNRIEISSGYFNAQDGSYVEFSIIPCNINERINSGSNIMPVQTIVDTLSLKITPNPSTGIFTITKETDAAAQITVYNLLGNVILKSTISPSASSGQEGGGTTTLDLTGHAKGIYFVTLTEGDRTYSEKIVVH